MWKNKHEAVSAKKPKKKAKKDAGTESAATSAGAGLQDWSGDELRYTRNDKVRWDGRAWMCRKSHWSEEAKTPGVTHSLWKEDDAEAILPSIA